MATVKCVKKSALPKKAMTKAGSPGVAAPGDSFVLVDNENATATIVGADAGGNAVDISGVATLTPAPTSSDPAILTVDAPQGMTFKVNTVGPTGHVDVTITATWTDGSKGPFTVTAPVDVVSGGPTGLLVQWGTPTIK